jgi:hypothetical protein
LCRPSSSTASNIPFMLQNPSLHCQTDHNHQLSLSSCPRTCYSGLHLLPLAYRIKSHL